MKLEKRCIERGHTKMAHRMREIAQLVKCSLWKQEDLNLILRLRIKRVRHGNPSIREVETD